MRKIISIVQKTLDKYSLIENGDKLAVGVSGGKDSIACLYALCELKKYYPNKFDLIAITVDNFSGKADYSKIENICKDLGIEYHIINTDINNIIFNVRKEKSPCSLCAKMRRGILCDTAKTFGCNKLVLAHHLDDVVNTFLMSLFYEGRLKSIKPKTYMSRAKVTVIRPLFLCPEKLIINASKKWEIFKNPCIADSTTKRREMTKILNSIKTFIPDAYERISHAILSNDSYDLL